MWGSIVKQFKSYKDVRIGVYAMCADEPEEFIDNWLESMKGADKIWVLVTKANNPNTDYLAQKMELPEFYGKLIVKEKDIKPWRFDTARNESLKMVDSEAIDALICTDIDEILIKDFWNDYRKVVFEHPNFNRILYRYAWNHNDQGEPDRVFWYDKTHQPTTYHWEYPVHETLIKNVDAQCEGEYRLSADKIYLHHYPDTTKSRGSYLGLLELRAQENPDDLYGLYYLGREYTFVNQYANCITIMTQLYLRLRERGTDDMAMKPCICNVIALAYVKLGLLDIAETWFSRGIQDDPQIRDNYINLAQLYAHNNEPDKARKILDTMECRSVYIEDWRILPYMWRTWKKEQILADACMWEKDYKSAAVHMKLALDDIQTDADKQYAMEEGFYEDLKFLGEHLTNNLTSNN